MQPVLRLSRTPTRAVWTSERAWRSRRRYSLEAETQEKRQLTEADFADVDFAALDAKSDYTRFLQAGVPDSIRNKALRRMRVRHRLHHARSVPGLSRRLHGCRRRRARRHAQDRLPHR